MMARPMMRTSTAVAALMTAMAIATASAAPDDATAARATAAPLTRLAQGDYYGGYTYGSGWGWGYGYIPACPTDYHYSCWVDAYGYRRCGCLPYRHW
jgi:hypothetical protein